MKCTQCGCKKLLQVELPFYTIDGRIRTQAKVYTCYECGHLELFDKSVSLDYKNNVRNLEKYTTELSELKKKLVELENPLVLTMLEDDCKTIERELSSLDITLRQQQELKSKLYELQINIKNRPKEVATLKQKINELERHIKELKDKISNTIIITEE